MAVQESIRRIDDTMALASKQQEHEPESDVVVDDEEEGEIGEEISRVVAVDAKKPKPATNPVETKRRPGSVAAYVPPAKRRRMAEQEQQLLLQQDGDSAHAVALRKRQQETWIEQQRAIHGTINRLNSKTIKPLIQELFQKVNLVRLRGVLCKSTLAAALSSPKYSNVYASLISVVNSKLPEVGELVVARSILAFRKHYQRREKAQCQAVCNFLAHLFHQAVVHELLVLQLLSVLLDGNPTDDSVEIAVELLQTTGQALLESSPAGVRACLERLRALLHEGQLNKRVEYRMEQLLKLRKTGFRDFPPIPDQLDLVERDDQITHETSLDDEELQKEEELDVFREDPLFEESEKEWAAIRAEILGEGDDTSDGEDNDDDDGDSSTASGSGDGGDSSNESEANEVPNQELAIAATSDNNKSTAITVVQDLTEQDLVHLRRTIYLTIMSSATFEECAHKLAKIEIPPGREMEMINMLIECCSQERTFLRYYGLIASRFCLLDDRWRDAFMESFKDQYSTIHRLETNKLRNVAKLFAHLLHTDAIPWSVLEIIHLNEDETTSSSRIFIKIVIQEMAEAMGIAKLKNRFAMDDEQRKSWYGGMFPKDNVRNTRYAINFFTSIGLGPLTDDLRDFLKNAPKLILAKAKEAALAKKAEGSDDSSSVSSSSSSSSSSSTSSSSSSSSTYSSSSSRSGSDDSSSRSSSSRSYSSRSSSSYSRRRGRSSRQRRRRRSTSSSYTSSSPSPDSRRPRRSSGRRGSASSSRSNTPPKEIVKTTDKNELSPLPMKAKQDRGGRPDKDRRSRRASSSPSPLGRRERRPRADHSNLP